MLDLINIWRFTLGMRPKTQVGFYVKCRLILNDINQCGLDTEPSLKFQKVKVHRRGSCWLRGLRRGFVAVRLLGLGSNLP